MSVSALQLWIQIRMLLLLFSLLPFRCHSGDLEQGYTTTSAIPHAIRNATAATTATDDALTIAASNTRRFLLEDDLSVRQILKLRLGMLKRFAYGSAAFSQQPSPRLCSSQRFIYVSEFSFGNSGNNLIEFTHGVWLADKWNATFIVPSWMKNALDPFDISFLRSRYCFRTKSELPQGKELLEVTSEESFFLFQLFGSSGNGGNSRYKDMLPSLQPGTASARAVIAELSLHFIRVYAGLWCCPRAEITAAGEWLIHNKLQNSLRYSAVHMRGMEGGCSKVLSEVTTAATDFSRNELPMDRIEWRGDLTQHHPLCDMPFGFVHETIAMHNRNGSKIFVAWDGRGDVSRYVKKGAVFSSMMMHSPPAPTTITAAATSTTIATTATTLTTAALAAVDPKFVDMFVAMHGDFFILNPRSTFSWQIYLIRVCLALTSVPVMRQNDLFLQKVPESLQQQQRPLWVSWTSVIDAFLNASPPA